MVEFDWSAESTEDIQHDLALTLADIPDIRDTAWQAREVAFAALLCTELRQRGAALPNQCRWEYDPYARGKRRLVYDLAKD